MDLGRWNGPIEASEFEFLNVPNLDFLFRSRHA